MDNTDALLEQVLSESNQATPQLTYSFAAQMLLTSSALSMRTFAKLLIRVEREQAFAALGNNDMQFGDLTEWALHVYDEFVTQVPDGETHISRDYIVRMCSSIKTMLVPAESLNILKPDGNFVTAEDLLNAGPSAVLRVKYPYQVGNDSDKEEIVKALLSGEKTKIESARHAALSKAPQDKIIAIARPVVRMRFNTDGSVEFSGVLSPQQAKLIEAALMGKCDLVYEGESTNDSVAS